MLLSCVHVSVKRQLMIEKTKTPRRRGELTRPDWVDAACDILIRGGIAALSLRKLAKALGVTTGAFYSLFRNQDELYAAVRKEWVRRNTEPFTRAIAAAGPDGMDQYLAYVRVLVLESEYDPRFDNAIRDWAHSCPETAKVLRDIEDFRISQLHRVFCAMGFADKPALIRARVTYFHQAGYNAMQIRETQDERLSNVPFYAEVLTERQHLLDLRGPDAVRALLLAVGAAKQSGR
jgi:AcrR family transcriptional regulator